MTIGGADTNYAVMDPLNINGSPTTQGSFDLFPASNATLGFSGNILLTMATTQAISPSSCTLSSIILTAIKGF